MFVYPPDQIFFGQNMKIHVYLRSVSKGMCWFFRCFTIEKNSQVGVSELRDRGRGSGQHTCWAPAPSGMAGSKILTHMPKTTGHAPSGHSTDYGSHSPNLRLLVLLVSRDQVG